LPLHRACAVPPPPTSPPSPALAAPGARTPPRPRPAPQVRTSRCPIRASLVCCRIGSASAPSRSPCPTL